MAVPRKSKKENELRYSFIWSIISIIPLICISVVLFFVDDYMFLIGCSPICLMSIGTIFYTSFWKIVIEEEYFSYRRIFLVTKKYRYSDIKKVKIYNNAYSVYHIYVGREKIIISNYIINSEYFIKKLRSEKVFKNAQIIRKKI